MLTFVTRAVPHRYPICLQPFQPVVIGAGTHMVLVRQTMYMYQGSGYYKLASAAHFLAFSHCWNQDSEVTIHSGTAAADICCHFYELQSNVTLGDLHFLCMKALGRRLSTRDIWYSVAIALAHSSVTGFLVLWTESWIYQYICISGLI